MFYVRRLLRQHFSYKDAQMQRGLDAKSVTIKYPLSYGDTSSSRCNMVNRVRLCAVMAESGCLSEVNYNHERGLSHELKNRLDYHVNPTRILPKECNIMTGGYVRSTARNDVNNFNDKIYSLFTIHLFIMIWSFHVSLLTFH